MDDLLGFSGGLGANGGGRGGGGSFAVAGPLAFNLPNNGGGGFVTYQNQIFNLPVLSLIRPVQVFLEVRFAEIRYPGGLLSGQTLFRRDRLTTPAGPTQEYFDSQVSGTALGLLGSTSVLGGSSAPSTWQVAAGVATSFTVESAAVMSGGLLGSSACNAFVIYAAYSFLELN